MTRVWEIPVPYLMLRAMLFSPERKPHLFRINQRNYVNMNGCLGDFMDCWGRKIIIQFLSSCVLGLLHWIQGTNELGIRQHPGLRIRSRLLIESVTRWIAEKGILKEPLHSCKTWFRLVFRAFELPTTPSLSWVFLLVTNTQNSRRANKGKSFKMTASPHPLSLSLGLTEE